MSSNGCIIPGTPIAVDFWRITGLNGADLVFFLTHLHGDHIVGLTSTWRYPIYCSELTAELLTTQRGVDKSLLRPLEVGSSHLVPVPSKDGDSSFIAVSVISANHCPGSMMFLFEGPFGKILHTGDFRYKPGLIENSILNDHKGSIDVIYLDNTFCSPECTFPTQHEARQTILDIIRQHRHCNVVLGMRKLGKENLLAWLALSLKEWVSVPGEMYSRIQTLELPNVFTISDKMARIRVEPFHLVSKKMLKRWNETKKTIVILPTAIYTGIGGTPYANQKDFFVVPYSDHSSYSELLEFVSKLNPGAVVPIVSSRTRGPFGVDLSSRADMSCFDKYCRTPANGMTCRQALRIAGKPSSILLPALSADGKRRPLKRKSSVGHIKVIKGVEYLSDGETSDGEIIQDTCSTEKMKAKICSADSVSNTETNLVDNCGNDRMKQKVIYKCSVANIDEKEKQNNCCNYPTADSAEVHSQVSYCDKTVVEKISCSYSTASSDTNNLQNGSDNRTTNNICFNYSVSNTDTNYQVNSYDETMIQKIGGNYPVARLNSEDLQQNYSDETVREKIHDYSDGKHMPNSTCEEKVKDTTHCNYSVTSSSRDNIQENCFDERVNKISRCGFSVAILDLDSCCDKQVNEKIGSGHSVTISDGQNDEHSCPDQKLKVKIKCCYSKSDRENIESISANKIPEFYCSTPEGRKPNNCFVTKLNSQTTISNDISENAIGLQTDPCEEKENINCPATNYTCNCNQEHLSVSSPSLPNCSGIKHVLGLNDNGFLTKNTKQICSQKHCLGPLTFKDPNDKLFSKCSILETYSVKSVKQTDDDHSTKKLVLALEKWLSDT